MTNGSRAQDRARRLSLGLVVVLSACGSPAASGTGGQGSVAPPVSSTIATPTAPPASPQQAATASAPPAAMGRPTDIPTNGACEAPHDCLGLLGPGTHHTRIFRPGFGFTMTSAGWENLADEGGDFAMLPIASPGDAILFFRQPKATAPDGTPVFSVEISVEAITRWLAANPALSVGTATDVTIGGLKGVRMDVAVAPGAPASPNCPVRTCVSIFKGVDPAAVKTWQWDWSTATSERQRLFLLTAADGGVIAIFVDSLDGTTFDGLTAAAATILATVHFDRS